MAPRLLRGSMGLNVVPDSTYRPVSRLGVGDFAQGGVAGAAGGGVEAAADFPDGDRAAAEGRGDGGLAAQPAGLGRGDRVARVEEVEEGSGDQVVEVGGVDGGAEGTADGDRVEGAVRA